MVQLKTGLAGTLALFTGAMVAFADLPLPNHLIALSSDAGQAMLSEADARTDYSPLKNHFVAQVHPAFCGPASAVMILNAMGLSPGPDASVQYDQVNLFSARTEAVKSRAAIMSGGMSLKEFSDMLIAHDLNAERVHAWDSSVARFRADARAVLADDQRYILVNYLRSAIGQETGGHISPLAAYDAESDRFLIMDVSHDKYPPVWVRARDLFEAMKTWPSNLTRGYVIVSVPDGA